MHLKRPKYLYFKYENNYIERKHKNSKILIMRNIEWFYYFTIAVMFQIFEWLVWKESFSFITL